MASRGGADEPVEDHRHRQYRYPGDVDAIRPREKAVIGCRWGVAMDGRVTSIGAWERNPGEGDPLLGEDSPDRVDAGRRSLGANGKAARR